MHLKIFVMYTDRQGWTWAVYRVGSQIKTGKLVAGILGGLPITNQRSYGPLFFKTSEVDIFLISAISDLLIKCYRIPKILTFLKKNQFCRPSARPARLARPDLLDQTC